MKYSYIELRMIIQWAKKLPGESINIFSLFSSESMDPNNLQVQNIQWAKKVSTESVNICFLSSLQEN